LRPAAPSPSKSYSIFGVTRGATIQTLASTDLEEEDVAFSSPELVRRIVVVFLVVFNVTLLLSIFFDAPLEEFANPGLTPNPAKAPWYFLWLQELVASTTVHLGRFTVSGGLVGGIVIPGLLLFLAAAWPFLDRSPEATEGVWLPPERRLQNLAFLLVSIAMILLILVGVYCRGPSWGFYWPWQRWPRLPTNL
jgi:cytochrome b-561